MPSICSTLPSRSTTSSMKKGRSSATRSESISCSLVICCLGMEHTANIQGGLCICILDRAVQKNAAPEPSFLLCLIIHYALYYVTGHHTEMLCRHIFAGHVPSGRQCAQPEPRRFEMPRF